MQLFAYKCSNTFSGVLPWTPGRRGDHRPCTGVIHVLGSAVPVPVPFDLKFEKAKLFKFNSSTYAQLLGTAR
jgi:hypothetical protein